MNKLERITLYALCAITLLLPMGCMSPEEQRRELARIQRSYEAGDLSYEQKQRQEEEVYSRGGIAFWEFIAGLVGTGVAAAFGGYKLTMVKRGPPATPQERAARKSAPK